MDKYVFSTLTASNVYPTYKKIPGRDIPVETGRVTILGGANLPSKVLVTPKGVMTRLTGEQFEQAMLSPAFKIHRERGFLVVEDAARSIAEVVADMEPKDESAPMVPEDFKAAGMEPPTTATPDEDDTPDHTKVRATQKPAQAATRKTEVEKAQDLTGKRKKRGPGRPRKDEASA